MSADEFNSGGFATGGIISAPNATGRPERVFSPEQVTSFLWSRGELSRRIRRAANTLHLVFVRTGLIPVSHRPRCRVCNPMANPRPLPIDGHAYAARRRARARRNR